jgi:hypothetical protein
MTTFYYADVLADRRVRACFAYDGPDEGPPQPHWESQAEGDVVLIDAPINWSAPTATSVLFMIDGALTWIEQLPIEAVLERAYITIDGAADAARMFILGEPTKQVEYSRAEAQARQYAAAGYADPVPPSVASWANAQKWTNDGVPWTGQAAADDIIATADRWYAGLDQIRDRRLDAKEHARAIAADPAGAPAAIEAIVTEFLSEMETLKKEVGT